MVGAAGHLLYKAQPPFGIDIITVGRPGLLYLWAVLLIDQAVVHAPGRGKGEKGAAAGFADVPDLFTIGLIKGSLFIIEVIKAVEWLIFSRVGGLPAEVSAQAGSEEAASPVRARERR